jgi:hypothetical protein
MSKSEYVPFVGDATDWRGAGKAAVWMTSQDPEPSPDAADVAHYIASVAAELSVIAKRHNFVALSYILDMARLEAEQIAQGWRDDQAAKGG